MNICRLLGGSCFSAGNKVEKYETFGPCDEKEPCVVASNITKKENPFQTLIHDRDQTTSSVEASNVACSSLISRTLTYDDEQQKLKITAQKIFSNLRKQEKEKTPEALIGLDQIFEGLSDLGIPLTKTEWDHIATRFPAKASNRFDEGAFCDIARQATRLTFLKSVVAESCLHLALERAVPQNVDDILCMKKDKLRSVFENVDFIQTAAQMVSSALSNRTKQSSGLARALNAKFISDGAELCEFGADAEFHGGLDEAIGLPDPFVLKGVFFEHMRASTSKTYFLTSNYGLCTTPEKELAFLLGREEDLQYLNEVCQEGKNIGPTLTELNSMKEDFFHLQKINKEVLESKMGKFPGEIGSWEKDIVMTVDLCISTDRLGTVRSAFIERLKERLSQLAESFATYKYDAAKYDEVKLRLDNIQMQESATSNKQTEISLPLEKGEFEEFWQDFVRTAIAESMGISSGNAKVTNIVERKWAFVEDPQPDAAAGRFEKQGRRRPTLRELMENENAREAGLRVEEVLVTCEYTGPMFMQMNRVLRNLKGSKNKYTTTLHCLVSATIKLARKTIIPKERKLWRGLGSRVLSEAKFFDRDERGTKGGVERGFLSTTTKMEVALQYSGHERHAGTVLEFDFGKVDCPAKIDPLSQYPGEGEMLFGPLSYLEVVGNPRLEMHQDSTILVVPIRINCNLKALTIEEIIAKRQRTQVSLIQSLMKEISFDFSHLPAEVIEENRKEDRFQLAADSACCIDSNACCPVANTSQPPVRKGKGLGRCSSIALTVISTVSTVDPLLSEALCSMEELWNKAKRRDDAWFNHDENFRHAWNEALDRKNQIVSSWWLRSLLAAGPVEDFRQLLRRLKERSSLDMLVRQATDEAKSLNLFKSALNEVDEEDGSTPLINQARLGNLPNVKLLLLARADVGAKDKQGKTALHAAAEWCQPNIVRTLIELGACLNVDGRAGLSILRYAEQHLLIKQFHPHPLVRQYYSSCRCDQCSERLTQSHTYRCNDCDYDLCLKCFAKAGRACARELKLLGADGWTPLMLAAEEGDMREVERLLSQGICNINATNHVQRTAIHMAAAAHHLDVMVRLCEAKADPNCEDRLGLSASDLADGPEMDQIRASRGWTPLITAAHTGDAEEVAKLIAAGTDMQARTKAQRTALHMAARGGHTEVVKLLAEGKADIQAKDEKGRSVLELAKGAECRHLLMSLGADGWNAESMEAEIRRVKRILCSNVWLLGGSLPRTGVIGLFFAGQRSSSCVSFTALLAELYHKIRARKQEFEVIYLSSDKTEEQFCEFYGVMPWLALPYKERRIEEMLTRRHKVERIPSLVLLDAASGDVLCTDGVNKLREDKNGHKFPWIPLKIDELLGRTFLGRQGEVDLEGKYVGILFAGRWCPACQRAVPRIINGYQKVREERQDFEIVFCSSDQSQEMFDDFFRTMPWLAIPYADRAKKAELSQRYNVEGIPTFILLTPERDEIQVSLRQDLEQARFPWAGQSIIRGGHESEADDYDDENNEGDQVDHASLIRALARQMGEQGNGEGPAECPVQ